MNAKNFFTLIKSHKAYLKELVIVNTEKEILKLTKSDFLVPIDQTKPDDIFIVGFPKSGNTWMQSLTSGLLYGIDTNFMPDKLAQEIVPDVHARKYYKRFGTFNLFKTHHLPQPEYRKVIYLVRDGRDAMVSYWHYNQKLGKKASLKEMVENGTNLFPSKWFEHVREWKKNPYDAEMIFVRYEDLLNQPLNELKKICSFLGLERSDELLERVISGNSINKMRQRVEKTGGMGNSSWSGSKGKNFFRKGVSGTYLNEMEMSLQDYFNNEASEELDFFKYQK